MYKTKCCKSIQYTFHRRMIGNNEHYQIGCSKCRKSYFIERNEANLAIHIQKEILPLKPSEEKLNTFFG